MSERRFASQLTSLRAAFGACLLAAAFACAPAPTCRAQGTSPKRGSVPGFSYAISDIESVNTTNGNLGIRVPLAALPAGRGGFPGPGVSLIYNSKIWDTPVTILPDGRYDNYGVPLGSPVNYIKMGSEANWRFGAAYEVRLVNSLDDYSYSYLKPSCESQSGTSSHDADQIYRVEVVFPDGGAHEFIPQNYQSSIYTSGNGNYSIRPDGYLTYCSCTATIMGPSCTKPSILHTSGTMTYYSTDGTYIRLDIPHDADSNPWNNTWTMYMPDGARVTGNGLSGVGGTPVGTANERIYDRNNNYVDVATSPAGTASLVDQMGRSITVENSPDSQMVKYVRATGFAAEPLVWTVRYRMVNVRKDYYTGDPYGGCPSSTMSCHTSLSWSFLAVERVELPAQAGGLAYVFDYNGSATPNTETSPPTYGWGELSSITMPTGAVVTYAYRRDNQNNIYWDEVLQNHPVTKTLTYLREYDGASEQAAETWTYSFNFARKLSTSSETSVTAPDLGVTRDEIKVSTQSPPSFDHGTSYRTTHPDGTVVERIWAANTPYGSYRPANPYVKTEFTSMRDAGGNLVRTAVRDYDFDKNGNSTRLSEYDWVPYGDVPRTNPGFGFVGVPTGLPAAAPLRVTTNAFYGATPNASVTNPTDSPYSYSRASAPRMRNSLAGSEIRDGVGQPASRTEFTYDDPYNTGNLTLSRLWDSERGALPTSPPPGNYLDDSNSAATRREYDDNTTDPAQRNGKVTLAVDANGNRTTYSYGNIVAPNGTAFAGLYPTAVVTAEGSAAQRTVTYAYDFSTGLVTRQTDEDNHVSSATTYDFMGRPTLVEEADGASDADGLSVERQTHIEYDSVLRRVITRIDLDATGDSKLVSTRYFDQLGRERLTRTLEDPSTQSATDENAGIKMQTRYLVSPSAHASYQLKSNPYRAAHSSDAGGEATMGWSMTTSDTAGRTVRVESFNGAPLPAPFGPNANSTGAALVTFDAEYTTSYDAAGHVRRTREDGLGRLVRVDEPSDINNTLGGNDSPAQPTAYAYDTLSNLVTVRQGGTIQNGSYAGGQARTYVYSSRSLLVSAANPEGGTVSYTYDANGNVKSKTDPRLLPNTSTHVRTDLNYDALGRVTSRTYNDGTPDVTYTYDTGYTDAGGAFHTVANARGRVTQVTSSVSSYAYTAYDPQGRVRACEQTTAGATYPMPAYRYDLANAVTSVQYPSGRVLRTEYDGAGRVAGVRNQGANYYLGGAPTDAANRISYAAHGGAQAARLGNGLWERVNYNGRLQPTALFVGTTPSDASLLNIAFTYGLDAAHNSGMVRTQTITAPGAAQPFVQTYDYDELSRLKAAEERSGALVNWRQNYGYDRFGNRTLAAGTTFPAQLNEINNPAVSPVDNRISSPGYSYDAAGNLLCDQAHGCPQGSYYAYDAEGRMKAAGGGASYVYDGDGRRVKKVVGAVVTVYVYDATGKLMAEYGGPPPPPQTSPTSYVTHDHLSSTRLVTGAAGEVKGRYDYYPFGEEVTVGREGYAAGSNIKQKFATYMRDEESGLDFAQNRYYNPAHGRFTSVDPALVSASAANPQTWNRYAYALNNPELYTDPLGLWALIFIPVYKVKDGKQTTEIDHYIVIAIKTKDTDTVARLAEQLGLRGKAAQEFADKLTKKGMTDKIEMAKVGGEIGRILKTVQELWTEQKKAEADKKDAPGNRIRMGEYPDCSATSANLNSQMAGANLDNWDVGAMDDYLSRNLHSKEMGDLVIGDVVRYALDETNDKGQVLKHNSPKHFTTFLIMNDDGKPMVFSRSGDGGPFQYNTATTFQTPIYGTIRGRGSDATGFYGKEVKKK